MGTVHSMLSTLCVMAKSHQRNNSSRVGSVIGLVELGYQERTEGPTSFWPIVTDAVLQSAFVQKLVYGFDVQQILVNDKIESRAPVVKPRTVAHNLSLGRWDRDGAGINFETSRWSGPVKDGDGIGRCSDCRWHDEANALSGAAHFVIRTGIAKTAGNMCRREVKRSVLIAIDDLFSLGSRIEALRFYLSCISLLFGIFVETMQ